MNTSGVDAPPEMSVASVARLVSVFVGAEVSVTLMSGYFASKSLISTCRTSMPLVLIGLAHQLMVPDVALPGAADVPLDGSAVLVLVLRAAGLLLLLLLQPATASAPTAPARAASCQPLSRRDEYLTDLCRAIDAPLPGDGRHIATTRSCTPACRRVRLSRPRRLPRCGRAAASGDHELAGQPLAGSPPGSQTAPRMRVQAASSTDVSPGHRDQPGSRPLLS